MPGVRTENWIWGSGRHQGLAVAGPARQDAGRGPARI